MFSFVEQASGDMREAFVFNKCVSARSFRDICADVWAARTICLPTVSREKLFQPETIPQILSDNASDSW
jgi:hypothetical protein